MRNRRWVGVGAVVGMVSSLLVFQYGQTRIWFAMSRDGLLPAAFPRSTSSIRRRTSSTWVAGWRWDCGGHLGYRHLRGPLEHRHAVRVRAGFGGCDYPAAQAAGPAAIIPRAAVAVVAVLSIVCCFLLMLSLPLETWLRFVVWLVIGLAIYFLFGRKHSTLAEG